jgi:hypothetical protein
VSCLYRSLSLFIGVCNSNIGTHRLKVLAEWSSQVVEGQVLTTAQTTEPCLATIETRRPKDPMEQPATQAEVFTMNTSAQNTQPHTNTKKPKFERASNKIQKKRMKQSSKMKWCFFARRMSAWDSCKSTWLGKKWWWKDLRSCSSRLRKKEQLKRSYSEQ